MFVLEPIQGTFLRARQILSRKFSAGFGAGKGFLRSDVLQVKRLAVENCPRATGAAQRALTVLKDTGAATEFTTGVGYVRTANQQEIKIEQGLIRHPHRSVEEHVHGPKGCSSGRAGWNDETEPVNVLAAAGFELSANPKAQPRPLARAIVAKDGNVIDAASAAGFRKGRNNVYRGAGFLAGGGGQSRLTQGLTEAVRRAATATAVLLCLLVSVPGFAQIEGVNTRKKLNPDTTILAPGDWAKSVSLAVRDDQGNPQYFNMQLRFKGYGDSPGLGNAAVMVKTGVDNLPVCAVQRVPATGDTLWSIPKGFGIQDSNVWQFPLQLWNADSFQVWILNQAGADTIEIDEDSTRVSYRR